MYLALYMDFDVNEAFDSITCQEEQICKQGFDEGFKKGENSGVKEGYHFGYHKGTIVGKEIGHYIGFSEALLISNILSSKLRTVLLKLHLHCNEFPRENQYDIDFQKTLENVRALYKLSCSLAGLNPVFSSQSLDLSY